MRALLALLLLVPSASATPVEVGWEGGAQVDHDEGGGMEPGDDRVDADLAADEVWVRSDAGPPGSVTVDPSDLAVEHGAFLLLNGTWMALNDSRPAPAGEVVAFESRALRTWRDGAYHPSGRWGIFLTLRPPGEPAGQREITVFWFCWTVCERGTASWARTDETEVQPFPRDVTLGRHTTSDSLSAQARRFEHCPRPQDAAACQTLASADPAGEQAADALDGATPELALALMVDRARLELGVVETPQGTLAPTATLPERASAAREAAATTRAPSLAHGPVHVPHIAAHLDGPPGPFPAATAAEAPRILTGRAVEEVLSSIPLLALAALGVAALVAGALLYHRIARGSALAQATRQRIYEAIAAEPGLRVGTLAGRLGLDYTTVRHHVRLLEKVGLVRGVAGGQRRLYAADVTPRHSAEAARVTSAPSVRAVLDRLRANGAVEQSRLPLELGLAPSTVTEAVQRLVVAGQAATERRGGRLWVVPPAFRPVAPSVRGAAEGA